MGPDLAVAFGAPSPPRSRRRVHAARSDALLSPLGPPCRHRELVNQIVHRIPRVALHPTEHDATAPHDLDERLPKVTIGNWLSLTVDPARAEPGLPPPVPKAIDDVRRVAHDFEGTVECPHRLEDGRDLHALIGGAFRRAAGVAALGHRPRPAARPRIPGAGTIGVHDSCGRRGQRDGVLGVQRYGRSWWVDVRGVELTTRRRPRAQVTDATRKPCSGCAGAFA